MASQFALPDAAVLAALVTSFFALILLILKEVPLFVWQDERRRRKNALVIYRHYADPIILASSSLFWRLDEILRKEGRGSFLIESERITDFGQYKYDSTLYRIAAVIGWLRAYHRELTFFSLSNPKKLRGWVEAIQEFERALADGAHVETQRVDALASVWGIQSINNNDLKECTKSEIGVSIDRVLQKYLHGSKVTTAEKIDDITQRLKLCRELHAVFEEKLSEKALKDNEIGEKCEEAIRAVSIREAWIYRDFQSAVGDLIITEIRDGSRRFEVIGFGNFGELLSSNDVDKERWINCLRRVIDDLDVSTTSSYDARVEMIKSVFRATVGLLDALHELDRKRGSLTKEFMEYARNAKEEVSRGSE